VNKELKTTAGNLKHEGCRQLRRVLIQALSCPKRKLNFKLCTKHNIDFPNRQNFPVVALNQTSIYHAID
jgi:hypothetical protein